MKTMCQQNFRRNVYNRGILNFIFLKESERHSHVWKGLKMSFINNPEKYTYRNSLAKREINKYKESKKRDFMS